jgi:hypothetical protein
MPAIGGTDPADLEAKACAELGFRGSLSSPGALRPPPRFGGSGGYPVWYREIQLEKFHAGEAIEVFLRSHSFLSLLSFTKLKHPKSPILWNRCPFPLHSHGIMPCTQSEIFHKAGSVLSTLVFTRQCTAGATVGALDDMRCQRIRAIRVRSSSSSSGTVFDRRRMTREKIPRVQCLGVYGSDKLRID